MRKRIRKWIVDMAPIWAKASLQAENRALAEENQRLRDEIDRLNAYIQGLQFATRALRRITINTAGDKN
ncbi:MAG: hypothetical protein MSS60_02705 [Clostridiales bacterium]|nr:hypothetical protein [Clostridiales bacterium]